MKVLDALRFARGLSRGLRRGDSFPPAGRRPPAPAPQGTREHGRAGGSPLLRAREEVGWFSRADHTIAIPGLDHPLTMLHLTDVHLRGREPWLDELAAALAGLRPDAVVLTGDVVTRGWDRAAVDHFLSALPAAPLGRWAIMGNWEYWAGAPPEAWAPVLAACNVRLLLDEWVDLGPVVLAGTDDQLAGRPDLEAALGDRPTDRPTVVLTHSPAMFPELVRPDVKLVLSGHSHAGQVRLPVLGAAWVPRGTGPYVAGWYQQDDTWLFVSRGVGWSIAPVRMWCPPEIALLHLVPA